MKPRHLLLAAALAAAAALALFGDRSADDGIAEPAARARTRPAPPPRATSDAAAAAKAAKATGSDAIRPLLTREALYGPRDDHGGTVLFAGRNAAKPPPASIVAPPLPFTYLGRKIEDGICEVYLGRGEQSLIVRERTVIDGTWRVDAIKPPTVTFTYLPLNQAQLLIIGGND